MPKNLTSNRRSNERSKQTRCYCRHFWPGLITGLLVGVKAAKSLSYLWNVPLIGINHIEGHIHSVEIPNEQFSISNIEYPALALIASGGHTELISIKKFGDYKKIGATVDDAAGECFDKAAKILGLEYPGGPKISKHAEVGDTEAIKFPRPMLDKNNFDFSFAGLKTSALYWLRDNKLESIDDFCASFEQAIIDVLVGKTLKAAQKYNPKTIILGGGVRPIKNFVKH
jgi:N6-L-threonylcarbamoyladenine synthase